MAVQRAAVEGDHVLEGGQDVDLGIGAVTQPAELGVGAVQVADDPLGVQQRLVVAQVGLPCRLQRGQAGLDPCRAVSCTKRR